MSDHRPPPRGKPRFLGALLFTHMTQGLFTTLPYVLAVYMVRDFLAAQDPDGLPPKEERVGKLTGLLGAMFCFAQLITSYPLGMLSDVVGRRLIIILGNISCVIGVIFFGLSSNFTQALVSRLGAGFFNAIIGAEKAMIGESLDSADQAKAMGHISLMWGIGTMIGPTMGGLLANPCNPTTGVLRWLNPSPSLVLNNTISNSTDAIVSNSTTNSTSNSGVCSPEGLFFRKPYLLPCLAASFMSLVATMLTIFYFDETLPKMNTYNRTSGSSRGGGPTRRGYMRVGSRDGRVNSPDDDEIDNLIFQGGGSGNNNKDPLVASEVQLSELHLSESTVLQIDKIDKELLVDVGKKERVAIEDSAEALENDEISAAQELELSLPWYKQQNVLLCLAGYALIAFCFILLDELIPIYASASTVDGGLGFPTSELALPLAFGGFVLVVWALFGFSWMHARLGVVKCTTIGLLQTFPMALLIPAATFSWAPAAMTMWIAMGFKAIAGTNAFTGCIILVNAVSPKESLGAVNGVGQTLAAAVRAAGPALGGLFWAWSLTLFKYLGFESSWGHQFLPFLFGGVVALATLGVYARVKLPLETRIIK